MLQAHYADLPIMGSQCRLQVYEGPSNARPEEPLNKHKLGTAWLGRLEHMPVEIFCQEQTD